MSSQQSINRFEGEHAFLSNFEPAEVKYGRYTFPTVENAYQFAKLPKDKMTIEVFRKFSQAHPAQAKRYGRALKEKDGLFRPDWEQIKEKVMRHLLEQKFAIPELRDKLLATGDAELIEGNLHHDNEWGDCRCDQVPKDQRKYGHKRSCLTTGRNKLGKMLMEIRAALANNDPFRCPTCLSTTNLAEIDLIPGFAYGYFENGEFHYAGETDVDWNGQTAAHNPPHFWCYGCKAEFVIPKKEVAVGTATGS